jgi:RimJ/RimL family protein N-acetyltransferase
MNSFTTGPETARLTHRAFQPSDAETFFRLNSHPEVMRYTGEPPLQSVEEAKHAIENYPDFKTVGYGRWACVHKDSQEVIGFCGLKYLPELDLVDVGFRFFPEYWGQGLGTEACTASIGFGFNNLNLSRIVGLVLPENKASIRVLEKCGLHPNGELSFEGDSALLYEINQTIKTG